MNAVAVRIRVGDERYAIDVEHVAGVAPLGEPTPVPGAPPGILGVRNVDGQLVPVLGLATLLGIVAGQTPLHMVIVHDGADHAALAVDELEEVASLPEATETTDSQLLRGATLFDGMLVGLIDLPALLAAARPVKY